MATDKQITGMTGVYLVAAELCRLNMIVSVTSRSAKGVDLLATTPDAKKTYAIQVKTLNRKQEYWLIDKEPLISDNLCYVFVRLSKPPEFYIAKSSDVAKNAYHEKYGTGNWHSFVPTKNHLNNWKILK